jgi:hypothetical protein
MEVDGDGEPLFVAEASATHLNHLDATINALSRSIAHLQHDRLEDPPQVFLYRPVDFPDRLKPTSQGPANQTLPGLLGPCLAQVYRDYF